MSDQEVAALEAQIFKLVQQLQRLQKENRGPAVRNYSFSTLEGQATMLELFGGGNQLLLIHNMGQACRYCTLWADGFNGLVEHLESAMSVVLVSKDSPETQRRFANSRGWKFRLASHAGGDYIQEQSVMEGGHNSPGAVAYERVGDTIYRKNTCEFGPGDLYCSMWSLLSLAGISEEEWTPQYRYWQRPEILEDGGENVIS